MPALYNHSIYIFWNQRKILKCLQLPKSNRKCFCNISLFLKSTLDLPRDIASLIWKCSMIWLQNSLGPESIYSGFFFWKSDLKWLKFHVFEGTFMLLLFTHPRDFHLRSSHTSVRSGRYVFTVWLFIFILRNELCINFKRRRNVFKMNQKNKALKAKATCQISKMFLNRMQFILLRLPLELDNFRSTKRSILILHGRCFQMSLRSI